jgi:hypothetical protein
VEKPGEQVVASLGGFRVSAQIVKTWRRKELELMVALDRTGPESEIPFSADLTALGLISRLEHALDHFDAELAEHRRSVVENTRRVVDYEPRLGGVFVLAGELALKMADIVALEDSLAQTKEEAEATEDELLDVTPRLRGASCDDEPEHEGEALEAA